MIEVGTMLDGSTAQRLKPSTRRSKIVCTIGPVSESPEMLTRLIDAGMEVARLNFSHGDHAWHRTVCERIRQLSDRVAILGDIQGPKLRIGRMQDDRTVMLDCDATFVLTSRLVEGSADIVSLDYTALPQEVTAGDRLYLNDGFIALEVLAVHDGTDIVCRVLSGGPLSSRKGINAPCIDLSAQIPTEKDRQDIQLAVEIELDFLAVSFVNTAADLQRVRAVVHEAGADIPLISKIERATALANFAGILEASDGVMVARGDLAVEIPTERVPRHQKDIIRLCNQAGKPVICATQMLESMCVSPQPSRAEVSDVFNAVLDGADAVMLSAESASGMYPVETVQMMARIICHAEAAMPQHDPATYDSATAPYDEVIGHSIATMVEHLARRHERVAAVLAITREGHSARMIAKYRPGVPIIAATRSRRVARQLLLSHGVSPMLLVSEPGDPAGTTHKAISQALRERRILVDDIVLTVSGADWTRHSHTNLIGLFAVHDLLETSP